MHAPSNPQGPHIEATRASAVADGDVDPITGQPFLEMAHAGANHSVENRGKGEREGRNFPMAWGLFDVRRNGAVVSGDVPLVLAQGQTKPNVFKAEESATRHVT